MKGNYPMENVKKYYWLKLKEDFFDDKVIKYLRQLPEGPTLVIIYLKMQLKSLKTEGFLKYDGILPTCEEELALVLDEKPMLVAGAINALEKLGVVERWNNDVLYMKAMQELIGTETASAARVRKHREMKKQQENDGDLLQCNATSLLGNGSVTKCNTEIEIDIRDREDLDREIDILPGAKKTPDRKPKKTEPSEPAVISLTLNDKSQFPVTETDIRNWQELYPAVNILQELRNMKGWLDANPAKRKTKAGIRRFINGWLSREQDKYHPDAVPAQPMQANNRPMGSSGVDRLLAQITGGAFDE
jgi:predicted phage replisome organizer